MKIYVKKEKFTWISVIISIIITLIYFFLFKYYVGTRFLIFIDTAADMVFKFGVYISALAFFFFIIIGFFLHELIHGVFCILFTKDFNSINFGIAPKQMMLYCQCKKPLYVNHYLLMLFAPFFILGMIPFIISLYFEIFFAVIFGYISSVAAVGDLYIIYLVLKNYQKKYVQDSPQDIGGEYI